MRKILFFIAILLAGCSRDPNVRKQAYLNSGQEYFKSGKYPEAVIEFRNAIQIDPRFAAAHWRLANAYLQLGSREEAYHELANAVSLEPKNPDAQLDLAYLLLVRRQYDEAQAAVEAALQLQPDSARAHAILGEKYMLTSDRPKGIAELQKAIQADPGRVEGYAALGAAYLANGQMADGEAAYKKGVAANPKSLQGHVALGQFWFSQRKMAEAEAEMRTSAALDARAVPPRLFLATIYVATNRLDIAERIYRELKTLAPDDPRAYRALGMFYLSTGQKEKAAAELESLRAAKPKDTAVKARLIEVLIDLNRMHQAQTLNQEALHENPADPQALLSNGRILMVQGKYREAAAALESAAKSDPNCARCYYLLGVAQTSLGLGEVAKASLTHARDLAPQSPATAAALAQLEAKSGNYGQASQLAASALQANPDLASAYVTEARALIAKRELPQAESRLEEALKRDPGSLPAIATLLSLYMREGKTQAAVTRILPLVEQHPQNAGLHVLLGVAYLNLKDLDRSAANARQALAVDPKAKDAYSLLGSIDLARGATEQAKSDFRAAIAADPSALGNYLALESQFESEKNWDEAKKVCERARQIDPGSPIVAIRLARLYLDHGGDINMAVSLAQMAKQRVPNEPAASDTLGWAYYKLGTPGAAVTQLKESVERAPHAGVFQYHLGMAYLAAGRPELAAQLLRRALASDPALPDAASAKATLERLSRRS